MPRREFPTHKKLHDFAERNGLTYLWSGTTAFAKRQGLLSPQQYEVGRRCEHNHGRARWPQLLYDHISRRDGMAATVAASW